MSAPIQNVKVHAAFQEDGSVESVTAGAVGVRVARGVVGCRRAVSCVVAPRVGDRVLVATLGDGETFVLAVLQRDDPAVLWTADGPLAIAAPGGGITVAAGEGIDLVARGAVHLRADAVHIAARLGEIATDALTLVGGAVVARFDQVKSEATSAEHVVGRLTQRIGRAMRFVSEFDQLRAAHGDWSFGRTLGLHAANLVATATELVKVDGDQIHLG